MGSDGQLSIEGSIISGNSASYGGGVESFGINSSVTVTTSTFTNNRASAAGGGIDDSGSVVGVTSSTLAGNRAGSGGAVEVEGSSTLAMQNSTLSGNTAFDSGAAGGIATYACGSATLSYVTLADNTTALAPSCGDVFLTGVLITSSSSAANCTGVPPTEIFGYNLDSGASCRLSMSTDRAGANAMLGPLAANGGPTKTRRLLHGSAAIDTGGSLPINCPQVDQRSLVRNWYGACDIGAFEVQR